MEKRQSNENLKRAKLTVVKKNNRLPGSLCLCGCLIKWVGCGRSSATQTVLCRPCSNALCSVPHLYCSASNHHCNKWNLHTLDWTFVQWKQCEHVNNCTPHCWSWKSLLCECSSAFVSLCCEKPQRASHWAVVHSKATRGSIETNVNINIFFLVSNNLFFLIRGWPMIFHMLLLTASDAS